MTQRLAGNFGVERAAALLRAGKLVAFGTETVYGLGADATDSAAVGRIFDAKGRPRCNPLICHYPDADAAFSQVECSALARRIAEAFWPGPLTLVLKRARDCPVSLLVGAGLDTLAVRVPAHPTARALLRAVGRPVAAPSANRSGRLSPSSAAHVLADLDGLIDAVLDTGATSVGVESTVLDLSATVPVVLRPGGVTEEMLAALSIPVAPGAPHSSLLTVPKRSPGLLASHYAPTLPLRLDARSVGPTEALLGFGEPLDGAGLVEQLSLSADLVEAASRLFSCLRRLDVAGRATGLVGIAAMPIPHSGLGVAIRDRLARAAAPR